MGRQGVSGRAEFYNASGSLRQLRELCLETMGGLE